MTERDSRIAFVAALLLTSSVAVNMAVFQNSRRGAENTSAATPAALSESSAVAVPPASLTASGAAVAPAQPGPAPTPASAQPGADVNTAEITKGIQRELNARGYEPGQPDGLAGLVTRAAIFAYEYDNGLLLTGEPSEPLLKQIVLGSSALPTNTARPGKTMSPTGESLVLTVRQQLAALGYQSGASGAALTPELARAIREFETDQKLKLTGRISAPMVSRLIRVQGEAKARREVVAKTAKR